MRVRADDGSFLAPEIVRSATATFSCEEPAIGADAYINDARFVVPYVRVSGTRRDLWAFVISGSSVGFEKARSSLRLRSP